MKLTWYGHAAFGVAFADTKILIDPFLSGNPRWDSGWEEPAEGCTHVLITHGHDDHIGDAVAICKATGAQVVGSFETIQHFAANGVENGNPGNHGGTLDCGGFTVTLVNALHSSSASNESGGWTYIGNPLGMIIAAPGEKVLYHMGDTGIFGDMALINELYRPQIGIVPIGDRFTMGAREAGHACRTFFDFETIVPCHYGTFPIIDQTPGKFLAELGDRAGRAKVAEIGVPFEV